MNRILLKRVLLLIVAIAMSLTVKSQSLVKYERFVDDGHVWHNCTRALETSDGNIIMMEECIDATTDFSEVYTESVNLLKISPQGMLIDSIKVDFTATGSLDSPFLRIESETNSNVMGSLCLNDDNELHYTAVFFDDNLSITNTIDIDLPVEGFTFPYKSIVDDNNDMIIVSKKDGSDDTYIFIKMDIYGEIKTIKYSMSEKYKNLYITENPLYIHSNNPLSYGCYFIDGAGRTTIETVILDDNFEILDFVKIVSYSVDGKKYVFDCTESEMLFLKDGNILMSSIVQETQGWNDELKEYIQLTKFNKEYEIVDYVRVASRLIYGDEGLFYINSTKSILKDSQGNIYLIYINTEGEYMISFINNYMELVWECSLEQTDANLTFLYDAFILDDNKLVVYGDYVKFDVGYFGFCYMVTNNSLSVSENPNNIRPYSFYPNPANDVINISFSPDVNAEKVEIYGMDGKLYHEQNFNLETISVNSLSNGIYMMKVVLDNGTTFNDKIVVK
ncbi:MAG: T9SS type A sorting domain-containing protein [Bacteroidales bacterium]|nr:T9SS type A sorting domain-containing protein [Bacteroidales bacterium]